MYKAGGKVIFVYVMTLAGAVVWLTAIFMAPFLQNRVPLLSDFLYAVYSPLCHQNPTRCFVLFGSPLAVCARCLGVYGGFLLGNCLYPLFRQLRSLALPKKNVLIVMSLPIAFDVAGNLSHLWVTHEWVRFLTGILWGSILPFFLIPGLMDVVLNKASKAKSRGCSLSQPVEVSE